MTGDLAFADQTPAGMLVVTQGVENLGINWVPSLRRHLSRDWGDMSEEDRAANESNSRNMDGAHSAYTVEGHRIWIITDPGHEVTTILLPEEY